MLAGGQGTWQFSALSHCLCDGFEQYKPEFLKQCLITKSQEEQFHKAGGGYVHSINANKEKEIMSLQVCFLFLPRFWLFLPVKRVLRIFIFFFFQREIYALN